MPLVHGYSRRSIASNIRTEERHGRSHAQAVAIALDVARAAALDAGKPGKAPARRRGSR